MLMACWLFFEQDKLTALHLASNNRHDEVVSVLLASNADVNTQNKVSHQSVSSHVSMYNYTCSTYPQLLYTS